MQARYEIGILFLFHNPLELVGKPSSGYVQSRLTRLLYKILLVRYFYAISVHDVLKSEVIIQGVELRHRILTLMIMTSVDWKREGFVAGSKTDALDWNDWKSPLMSRVKAKLFRNRTYRMLEDNRERDSPRTRFDIAVLNKTRSVSS
jgi:hypothetical protein